MIIDPITKMLINREGRSTANCPLLLMYHGTIPGAGKPANRYNVNAARFRQQIDFLNEYGWKTLCVRDLYGTDPLPLRSVLITFDDGFRNNFANAFLPLVDRGMRATWFMVSRQIGLHAPWMGSKDPETAMLDFGQIREMIAAGMEIGSHTSTHPDLTAVSTDLMRQEISGSKEELEDVFSSNIESFAYPYGRYNKQAVNCVHEAGYRLACGVRAGMANIQIEPYELRRVTVFAEDTLACFARKMIFATNNASWTNMVRYVGDRMSDRLRLVRR